MTREVVTVGPDTSAKYAAEVMTERGFTAFPVLDDDARLIGIVAEADLLRDRLPADPRLHARRDEQTPDRAPSVCVRGLMRTPVRSVDAGADMADATRLFVDERLCRRGTGAAGAGRHDRRRGRRPGARAVAVRRHLVR